MTFEASQILLAFTPQNLMTFWEGKPGQNMQRIGSPPLALQGMVAVPTWFCSCIGRSRLVSVLIDVTFG